MAEMDKEKIVITGAAGLVGQNLIPRFKSRGCAEIVGIDKHHTNLEILEKYHPEVRTVYRDLYEGGTDVSDLIRELTGCSALVIAHAQIGGLAREEFVRNNIVATERLLEAALKCKVPYVVSISSSVVNSMAVDSYTETKKAQEALVAACGIAQVVLRPTLMFGWFDRKHLGWLARFMQRTPVFPVPGDGRFTRQPLFAGDFCEIIVSSILNKIVGAYNITGQERIDYIDLIRAIKRATGAATRIQEIPYGLFWALLKLNAQFRKNPEFTVEQLKALVTPDIFEIINWPAIFNVRATPLQEALALTFRDSVYSNVVLDF